MRVGNLSELRFIKFGKKNCESEFYTINKQKTYLSGCFAASPLMYVIRDPLQQFENK